MKKGFTLLELIIVIIIIGILATLGFVQYTAIIEKGRRAEAASILGSIRSMAVVWNQEGGHATAYPNDAYLISDLQLPSGTCAGTHYFHYTIVATTGLATATRCTTANPGKPPQGALADTLTLTIDGTKGGSVTW